MTNDVIKCVNAQTRVSRNPNSLKYLPHMSHHFCTFLNHDHNHDQNQEKEKHNIYMHVTKKSK